MKLIAILKLSKTGLSSCSFHRIRDASLIGIRPKLTGKPYYSIFNHLKKLGHTGIFPLHILKIPFKNHLLGW
jgi:hypothetical protein